MNVMNAFLLGLVVPIYIMVVLYFYSLGDDDFAQIYLNNLCP